MKISQKLVILTAIPLVAFFIVSLVFIKNNIEESNIVNDMANNTKLLMSVSDLIHELQRERGRTSIFLSGGSRDDMESQRKSTDSKIPSVTGSLSTATISSQTKTNTTEAISEVERIRNIANQKGSAKEVVDTYGKIISDLMSTETTIANSKTTRVTCPPKPEPGILLVSGQRREGNGQERASTGADNRQAA